MLKIEKWRILYYSPISNCKGQKEEEDGGLNSLFGHLPTSNFKAAIKARLINLVDAMIPVYKN